MSALDSTIKELAELAAANREAFVLERFGQYVQEEDGKLTVKEEVKLRLREIADVKMSMRESLIALADEQQVHTYKKCFSIDEIIERLGL